MLNRQKMLKLLEKIPKNLINRHNYTRSQTEDNIVPKSDIEQPEKTEFKSYIRKFIPTLAKPFTTFFAPLYHDTIARIILPYTKFADRAYSETSAEELREWTDHMIAGYLSPETVHQRSGVLARREEDEELSIEGNDHPEENVSRLTRYIHENIDASFAVDEIKYALQRFILPGLINAIINDKLNLVDPWLDPKGMEMVELYKKIKTNKIKPIIYHLTDVTDPFGIKEDGKYILTYTFSLIYALEIDGKRSKVLDKRVSFQMAADRSEYPNSILCWRILNPSHLLYLLIEPQNKE